MTASYAGQATDGCAQTGAVCTGSTVVDMQQLMGVANATTVNVFELGSLTSIATITASRSHRRHDLRRFRRRVRVELRNALRFDGQRCGFGIQTAVYGEPVSITNGVERPQGIAFDSNGNLYVANDVVLTARPNRSPSTLRTFRLEFATMSYTNTVNQPEALAISAANDLFVSELTGNSGNGQVIGFSSSYSSGPPI